MIDIPSSKIDETHIKRWFVLLFLTIVLYAAYFFSDVLTPLKVLLDANYGWDGTTFDFYNYSGIFINAIGFVLFSGMILDRFGIRFTGKLASALMLLGAMLNLYAFTRYFINGGLGNAFFNSFLSTFPNSAKLSILGKIIFSIGLEMISITSIKTLAKWFSFNKLALSFGLLILISRVGTSFALFFSSDFADVVITENGVIKGHLLNSMIFSLALIIIGSLAFYTFNLYDKKNEIFNTQNSIKNNEFKIKDFLHLLKNKSIIYIAILYGLFFTGIFGFYNFVASNLLININITQETTNFIIAIFPLGTVILSPFFGNYFDKSGKSTRIILYASILLTFAFIIIIMFPTSIPILYTSLTLVALSFSVIPGILLPSAVKIIDNNYLGRTFAVFFWSKNIGIILIAILTNYLFTISNPSLSEMVSNGEEPLSINYNLTFTVFFLIGIFTILFAYLLEKEKINLKN